MICTSIQHKRLDEIWAILDDPYVEMAEIRLDLCDLTDSEIEELFSESEKPLIATCRVSLSPNVKEGQQAWNVAQRQISLAASSGARYVDLEVGAPVSVSQFVQKVCRKTGAELIRSYHDFSGTPEAGYLRQIISRCFRYGADVAKIVTTATCDEDCAVIDSLYTEHIPSGEDFPRSRLVAFAMGEKGSATRVSCLRRGAPFSYCAYDEPTAAGQASFVDMHNAVYGDFPGLFRDDFSLPASKSFAQRAIIAGALADGVTRLHGYTPCEDSESAVKVARALGAKVRRSGRTLTVTGIGSGEGRPALEAVHCGESGLLARLMIPLMSLLSSGSVRITGEGTLTGRPLKSAADIMASFGVVLKSDNPSALTVPLTVEGTLTPGTAEIDGSAGSQIISGLLMALPLCSAPSRIHITRPKSIPYLFITLDILRKFGIEAEAELEGDQDLLDMQDWSGCTGISLRIRPGQRYRAADIELEADWSAAANFLVGGAVFGGVLADGLDDSSIQADISIMDVLVEAGAAVASGDGMVSSRKAPLEAFDIDLNQAPDLFPIVSVLAAFCAGTSTIAGLGRLRGKESDRASAIVEMLSQMGVRAAEEGDVLSIEGETLCSRILNGRLLKGGRYTSRHDHRMAMALRIAAIGADSPVEIDDTQCVAKSFPGFFEEF